MLFNGNVRFENFMHMEWSEEKFLKGIVGDKRRLRFLKQTPKESRRQRRRSTCKDCGGSSLCEHQRRRSPCKDCGVSTSGGGASARTAAGAASASTSGGGARARPTAAAEAFPGTSSRSGTAKRAIGADSHIMKRVEGGRCFVGSAGEIIRRSAITIGTS